MRRVIFILVPLLAACDAWFFRQIDIASQTLAVTSSLDGAIEVIKKQAAELELPCQQSGPVTIQCYRQPVRICSVPTEKGVFVCYYAMGAPFERSKNERRIAALEKSLVEKFGASAVSSQEKVCPPPPAGWIAS